MKISESLENGGLCELVSGSYKKFKDSLPTITKRY